MRKISTLLLCAFALLFVACGGGGGGDNQTTIPLKTTTIRDELPGDYWTYSTTLTRDYLISPPLTDVADMTFTNLNQLVQNPYNSDWCIDTYYYGNFSGYILEGHSYWNQDFNGVYYYGNDEGWIIDPPSGYVLQVSSPMAVGQNLSYSFTRDNGDEVSVVRIVQAIEEVSCPLGRYEAFKVISTYSLNYPSGNNITTLETSWFVPGLGAIKTEEEGSYYVNGSLDSIITVTQTLIETNVSY